MTELERDREVERALATLRTPEHREGFWEELEGRVAGGDARPASHVRGRALALAATLLAVVSVAALLNGRDGTDRRVTADQPAAPATTAPVTPGADGSTPDGAVRQWLAAIGEGDIDRAVALTGPRTERYIRALGGNLPGLLTEMQEGYGAWVGSPDLSTTEVDLPISARQITIVVVSGTWTGEGDESFRTDALPVVDDGDGWRVEPSAFAPDTGGRLELISPEPSTDGTKPTMAPGAPFTAASPARGTFYFSLNDGEVVTVEGAPSGAGSRGTWQPDQALPPQTHLLVAAFVGPDTITAVATRVAVQR